MPKDYSTKLMAQIYADAFEYVKEEFKHHGRPDHDFRNRFAHTLRVMEWANRIIKRSRKGNPEIIRLAILFHDAGWKEKRPHNEVGANMANEFLKKYDISKDFRKKVVSCARHHNVRGAKVGIDEQIVMDADLLDETGITALLFDTFQTAYRKNPSYAEVLRRSSVYYDRVQDHAKLLRTKAGKWLFKERLKIYRLCIDQMRFELDGEKRHGKPK